MSEDTESRIKLKCHIGRTIGCDGCNNEWCSCSDKFNGIFAEVKEHIDKSLPFESKSCELKIEQKPNCCIVKKREGNGEPDEKCSNIGCDHVFSNGEKFIRIKVKDVMLQESPNMIGYVDIRTDAGIYLNFCKSCVYVMGDIH